MMKTLGCSLVFLLLIFITFSTDAQKIGVKVGYSLSDMLLKDDGDNVSDELSAKSGFHFGPTIEFEMNDNFCIETALLFTTKGISVSESETFENISFTTEAELNLFYVDIPVYAKAYIDAGNVKLYGMLGPYVGIGISGKSKMEGSIGPELYSEEDDISWGSDEDDDLKRFETGIALGLGMNLNSFLFEVSTHMSLSNISPQSEYDMIAKNRLFLITVGYQFGE